MRVLLIEMMAEHVEELCNWPEISRVDVVYPENDSRKHPRRDHEKIAFCLQSEFAERADYPDHSWLPTNVKMDWFGYMFNQIRMDSGISGVEHAENYFLGQSHLKDIYSELEIGAKHFSFWRKFLEDVDLVLTYRPVHMPYSMAIRDVAAVLNIPLMSFSHTSIPYRSHLVKNGESYAYLQGRWEQLRGAKSENNFSSEVLKEVERISTTDETAFQPGYMSRIPPHAISYRYFSRKNLSKIFVRDNWIKLVVNLFQAYLERSVNQSIEEEFGKLIIEEGENKSAYLVVFLHYQPEETSSPRGGFFANQLNIVRWLRLKFPDKRILVKEHPHRSYRGYRPQVFYRELARLGNVFFTKETTTNLLEKAEAVATICGTVGLEAAYRGVPVLLFGWHSLAAHPFAFRISAETGAKEMHGHLEECIKVKSQAPLATLEYLQLIFTETIDWGRPNDTVTSSNFSQHVRGALKREGVI